MEKSKLNTTEIFLTAQALLTKMSKPAGDPNETFDSCFARIIQIDSVELTKGNVGTFYFSMVMPSVGRNIFLKNIHAGAQATIVDLCSFISAQGFDSRSCVSVNLSFEFIGRVDVGKEYIIRVDVQKQGKKIGYNKIQFIDPITEQTVLTASHVYAFTAETFKL